MRRDAPTKAGGEQTVLQLAYFDRSRAPVVMDVGPVLALEDVAGGKVCALASRVEIRDYADTARMLDRYSPSQLIGFARRLDPGLTDKTSQMPAGNSTALPTRSSPAMGLASKTSLRCAPSSRLGRAPRRPSPRKYLLAGSGILAPRWIADPGQHGKIPSLANNTLNITH